MLKREYRLPLTKRLENASTIRTPIFTVKIARNTLSCNRYGFIISKRIDKRSVKRNRLKRRFRACIEQCYLKVSQGYDLLFVLTKNAQEESTEKLCEEVKKMLYKSELLK